MSGRFHMPRPCRPGYRPVRHATRPIVGAPRTSRTLHPPRRSWTADGAPEGTIDGLVTVTLPVVPGWWGDVTDQEMCR